VFFADVWLYIVSNFGEGRSSNFGEEQAWKWKLYCSFATIWRSSFIQHAGVQKRIGLSHSDFSAL